MLEEMIESLLVLFSWLCFLRGCVGWAVSSPGSLMLLK